MDLQECFTKLLTATDVARNLEIPNRARFLPIGNAVMRVIDQEGNIYEFIASERADGRRSLTRQWRAFAVANNLRAGEFLRIYRSGNGNHYVVHAGVELHGHIIWERL
ncbi:unnamed protein product [Ilex paraguariensis]|uniref:TF-B3 domain-containing protein n=1 Tax=Ilex paraguariensis TaxID=185542 RepID=A0ABC8TXR3_9AQUA